MAREFVQLAQCAALQPLVAPNPQTRTAETPLLVNARTALALQSTLRDIPTCWCRDWLQTTGPTLLWRSSIAGIRSKRSSRSLVFLARNSSTKSGWPMGTSKTLNPWALVGSAWFPRHTTALGSNTRANVVSSSTLAGVVPLRFHIFVFPWWT